MIIKLLPKKDLPRFAELRGRYLRKRPLSFFREHYTNHPNFFAACYKGKDMIGIVCARSWYSFTVLQSIGVEEKFRKKGIGSGLLKFLEKQLRKEKIKKYSLTAHPRLVPFYKKNGFKVIKAKKIRGKDLLILEKILTA